MTRPLASPCGSLLRNAVSLRSAQTFESKVLYPSQRAFVCLICVLLEGKAEVFEMVVGEGFEPSKSMTADLQSAPFGRSGTPPRNSWISNCVLHTALTSFTASAVAVNGAHNTK